MTDREIWALEDQCTELQRTNRILSQRVTALEARFQTLYHALVAHAGDLEAHPCSANNALSMLRALSPDSEGDGQSASGSTGEEEQ
jgi:hypothetical protein